MVDLDKGHDLHGGRMMGPETRTAGNILFPAWAEVPIKKT